jgi:hypothetical protein
MCCNGIEGRNVSETQLAQCALDNGYASFIRRVRGCRAVDCLYDFIDVRRDEGVGEFEKVEFKDGSYDGDFVLFKSFDGDCFAVVESFS